MKLYEEGLLIKSLFNATDDGLQGWLQSVTEVPSFLEEVLDAECRDCKYYSAKVHGGCREIDCFKTIFNDLPLLREGLVLAYNHGYWHDGQLNDWMRPEVMIAEMFG